MPPDRDRPPAYAPVAPTDLHPQLLAALRDAAHADSADIWECRVCTTTTRWVVVVPYDGAWRHAVDPCCDTHHPEPAGVRRICTSGWPGPATPTRGARRRNAEEALTKALAHVEAAARELDALFGGDAGAWTLDGEPVDGEAVSALLSLHDYLNDATNARAALEEVLSRAH